MSKDTKPSCLRAAENGAGLGTRLTSKYSN